MQFRPTSKDERSCSIRTRSGESSVPETKEVFCELIERIARSERLKLPFTFTLEPSKWKDEMSTRFPVTLRSILVAVTAIASDNKIVTLNALVREIMRSSLELLVQTPLTHTKPFELSKGGQAADETGVGGLAVGDAGARGVGTGVASAWVVR